MLMTKFHSCHKRDVIRDDSSVMTHHLSPKRLVIETLKVSFSDADSDDLESLGAFAVASFKPQPGKKRKNESAKDGQKNPKQGKYKRNGYIYSNISCSI